MHPAPQFFRHWLPLCLWLVCVDALPAARLLDEPFNYPEGPLIGASGSPWIHHSPTTGSTGEVQIVGTNARLAFANDEDVSVLIPGQPYAATPGTNLFASCKVNFSVLPSGGGSYFAHFKDSGNIFRARLWAFADGASAGGFRLGLSSVNASPLNVTHSAVLSLNTDYLVVLKVSTATGASTLWINPTNETSPSVTTSENVSGFTAAAFALREASGMGVLLLDDLVVGTTFTDVFEPAPPVPPPASGVPVFSIVTYNVRGNAVEDWSTNSPQVRAIGRQMQFLNPDIVTFQEIPYPNTWQMGNFVAAFLPGYALATNSGTDGFIRSAILSRFPIVRSTKWLDGVSLASFGYAGTFTRDLFEAQISVPGFSQPLHVFTTHLKSGQDADSVARRGAEARTISNFFAIGFLSTNALHPYVLTGDLNEDIARPSSGSAQPIQSLANDATGLQLSHPLNPFTRNEMTFSIQAGALSRRYDYVLPGALLATNVASSEVFRSDLATNLVTALPGDSVAASDHLPVRFVFNNPFAVPFSITSLDVSNAQAQITWSSVPGGRYHVEAAGDLTNWVTVASNIVASSPQTSFATNVDSAGRYFRVKAGP